MYIMSHSLFENFCYPSDTLNSFCIKMYKRRELEQRKITDFVKPCYKYICILLHSHRKKTITPITSLELLVKKFN